MLLTEVFLAHVSDPERFRERSALERTLVEQHARGREAWPGIDLPSPIFIEYLASRVAGFSLEELNAPGLYLACACAQGSDAAVRVFRDAYRSDIQRVLTRMGVAAMIDEVSQGVLDALFVKGGITGYGGRGELRAWVRVVAVREAYNVLRRSRRDEERELPAADEVVGVRDPELDRLKAAYRTQFKLAFERAFEALPSRDRTLLRYQFLDGLRLEQIAVIHDVSRATAARWLQRAREQLLEGTRRSMREELNVSRGELDSVMNLIESQLDVSITRLLRRDS
ncbi:MAG TPA: sigma-70 family RNA polymerase sigma factor [Polyangiaceae bacterium]|jgi:RNA polymerase sigma-70 factor, ECF subfamily|nr:sigma-70 family RNA polymerase sigma factor [Polyangiaceae bacterium]